MATKGYALQDSATQITPTELSYLSGATSNIQTQINTVSSSVSALNGTMMTVGIAANLGNLSNLITWTAGNSSSIFYNDNIATAIRLFRHDIATGGTLTINNDGTNAYWFNNTSYQDAICIANAQGATDYIYMWAQKVADSIWYLLRITISDQTVTEMTFSGTAPDNDNNNKLAFDSTGKLWVLDAGTTTVRSYTISGTTATYGTAVTLSGTNDATYQQLWCIDKNNNFVYATSGTVFRVDNSSGVNQKVRVGVGGQTTAVRFGIPRCLMVIGGVWYGWSVINTDSASGNGLAQLQVFNGY